MFVQPIFYNLKFSVTQAIVILLLVWEIVSDEMINIIVGGSRTPNLSAITLKRKL